MEKNIYSLGVLLLILGSASSCQKDLESNSSISTSELKPSLGFKIQVVNRTFPVGVVLDNAGKVTSSSYNMMHQGAVNASFTWDSAYMNISKIKFFAEQHEMNAYLDSTAVTQEWNVTKKVDLFNLDDQIGSIRLQPANYSAISVSVNSVRKDFGTTPVFYLSGIYTNSAGVRTPVKIEMNENISVIAEQPAFAVDSIHNHNFTNIVQVNLSSMMSHLQQSDLDNALLTNGKMIINMNSNPGLYWYIRVDFDRSMFGEIRCQTYPL